MGLQQQNKGNYTLRFRLRQRLIPYFNKRYIYKSLGTNKLQEAQAKAFTIKVKYNEILQVLPMLTQEQIQELVDNYIYEQLQQDKTDRATYGWGTIYGFAGKEYKNDAEASLDVVHYVLSEYKENLANSNYILKKY